ncbi:putative Aquaporin AQPAe.a [Hypsibius exemplaris]|uniref:Aquaporin AQPAe.a n=1 Tax=Hypsibius exemplaris TaxID=2072580 RepID=A0A9X6RLK1_HYPEX|nr:putative Aquaporin AQPAe.a [Hypsibius exemplaris]
MWLINPRSSIEDLGKISFWKALAAEFIGTGFLVFVGCGAAVTSAPSQGTDAFVTRVALTFGLTVATMVWCICGVSGGHINPAVTVAFLVTRKISLIRGLLYMAFQCSGAVAGAALLFAVSTTEIAGGGFGCNGIRAKDGTTFIVTGTQAVLIEALITFVLIFTVFATCDSKRGDLKGSGPLQIGIAVLICHLAVIPLTGSSMNPARSLGPAVIRGDQCWNDHHVYWIGPMIGGAVAGLMYDLIFAADSSLRKLGDCLSGDDYDAEDDRDNDTKRAGRV